ncbi:ThuA domain-containing protein [Paenibacillus sp. HB172176]|uniref:ThuA domain-containing protein n=1 Tax=Paenibacillus sp. HB172176 TaxID=2493690 RepID=UPI0014390380|nr:ThuA domain-containing protein [Paenibacillus sp. HB172176]
MKKILAYLGDYYHPREPIEAVLREAVQPETENGELELIVAESIDEFMRRLSDKPHAAVLYAINKIAPQSEPGLMWMNESHAEKIARYAEEGGGFLAWHAGMASYPESSPYVRLLRGYFVMHPPLKSVRYEGVGKWSTMMPFELLDEHYMINCDERDTEVFLRSYSEDGESIAGWRHEIGSGRVCCLTPAHKEEAMREQTVMQLLRECVSWTAQIGS